MRLKLTLLKWWRTFFLPELHDDVEYVPAVVWWKAQKGNLLALIKGTKTSSKKILQRAEEQWDKLNDQFTDHFGIQQRQRRYIRLISELQEFRVKFAVTKSFRWYTSILRTEAEIESMLVGAKDVDEYEMLLNIQMVLEGTTKIDPKVDSIIEFETAKRRAIQRNKEILARNKRK